MSTPQEYFDCGFGTYIYGIPAGMDCEELKASCIGHSYLDPYIYTASGSATNGADVVCTGMYVNYLHGQTIEVAVYGDCDGDGNVDSDDRTALNNLIMSGKTTANLTPYTKAADMNFDGTIDVGDLVMNKSYISTGLGNAIFHESAELASIMYSQSLEWTFGHVGYKEVTRETTYSKETTLSAMQNATIFGFGGHGYTDGSGIIISDDVNIKINDIAALSSNAFSKCRLVMFGSCSVAYGGVNADNFANAVYDKGADTVIAFSEVQDGITVSYWLHQFSKYCGLGHSVEEASLEANYDLIHNSRYTNTRGPVLNGLVILGDTTQRLAQPLAIQEYITGWNMENHDPLAEFESNLRKEYDTDTQKGYYDLAAFHAADADISTYTVPQSRSALAEEALGEYIDIEDYTYVDEYYNESLNVYTLAYSKLLDGIETSDMGYVMIKNGSVIAVSAIDTGAFDTISVPVVSENQIFNYLIQQKNGLSYSINGYGYNLDEAGNPIMEISITVDNGEYDTMETVIMPLQ